MKTEPSRAPSLSAVRRALVLAGGALVFTTSCSTTPTYGPDGNVFAQPRYGYGSPNQPADSTGRPLNPADDRSIKPDKKKIPNIKRDPNDTTIDVTPPESMEKNDPATEPTSGDTPPPAENTEKEKPIDPTEAKPVAPREDLPYGRPVVGKNGFVYSPYAPDAGEVDARDIPAGTKVKCPYTSKVFRVP